MRANDSLSVGWNNHNSQCMHEMHTGTHHWNSARKKAIFSLQARNIEITAAGNNALFTMKLGTLHHCKQNYKIFNNLFKNLKSIGTRSRYWMSYSSYSFTNHHPAFQRIHPERDIPGRWNNMGAFQKTHSSTMSVIVQCIPFFAFTAALSARLLGKIN